MQWPASVTMQSVNETLTTRLLLHALQAVKCILLAVNRTNYSLTIKLLFHKESGVLTDMMSDYLIMWCLLIVPSVL